MMVSLSHAVVEIYRLNNAADWQPMMPDILSKLGNASNAEYVALFQCSLNAEGFLTASEIVAWSADRHRPARISGLYHIPMWENGLYEMLERLNQNENFSGTAQDLAMDRDHTFFPPGLQYTFIVPVFVTNRLWGMVRFDYDHEGIYRDKTRQNILSAAVGQIATAIERIERHISRGEHEHRLTRLYSIMEQRDLLPEERIHALLEVGLEELKLDTAIISSVVDSDYIVQYVRPSDANITPLQVFDRRQTYCDVTLTLGKTIAIAHAEVSEFNGHPGYLALKHEAYIGSPLILDGHPDGTVSFSSPNPHWAFSAGDRAFVNEISRLVSRILDA